MPQLSINGKQVTIGNVNSFGVFKGSKYPEQAWEFVKWAAQTGPDETYAKLSDVPSDSTAFTQMSTYITPSVYVPTLLAAGKVFQTDVMTPHPQYSTDVTSITTDLANGKLTPAQASAMGTKRERGFSSGVGAAFTTPIRSQRLYDAYVL